MADSDTLPPPAAAYAEIFPKAAQSPGVSQMVAIAPPGPPPVQQGRNGEVLPPRRKRRGLVLPLIALAALGFGAVKFNDWFTVGRFLVATDDAYVKADVSILAAKVAGYVTAVPAADNAFVKAGDLLASIDDGDYRLAVDAAAGKIATQDATIARFTRQADAQNSAISQAKAQLQAAQGQLAAAKADQVRSLAEYDRTLKLMQSSYGTQQKLDSAQADRDRSAATVASGHATGAAAQAAVDAAYAALEVLKAQKTEAERARAELQIGLARAQRDLAFTQIRAPFDGMIGNRAAQAGAYVQTGTRLMALIPLDSIYVEANFKETQLLNLKPGQKVSLNVDAIAGHEIEGTVLSIAPASGSQYSLLPPENATGNFTKIVQRVPVRIQIPVELARSGALRPGLSVAVDVHTRDESLPKPTLMGALGLTPDGH